MNNRDRNFRVRLFLSLTVLLLLILFALLIFNHGTAGNREHAGAGEETEALMMEAEEESEGSAGAGTREDFLPETADEASPVESAVSDALVEEARRKRAEEERYAEYQRQLARNSRHEAKVKPQNSEESQGAACVPEAEEETASPPTVMFVSDLHYISPLAHDDGEAFWEMVWADDGKLSPWSADILEALIDEAIERQVSALVMAGDNTLNGELINHSDLAARLSRLTEAGIAVLPVPGNHDIMNTDAAVYFGASSEETEYLHSAEEYYEIYQGFYEGANGRDPASLSFVYPLDETHWILLLDSAWYEDRMHVGGRIREGTLAWIEDVLKAAEEAGAQVIPVAHHNLLSESRVYTKECLLENAGEVLALFEEYRLPLYVSGHLHAQRIKKHKSEPGVPDTNYGITEIVLAPLSIAPCQYGILSWDEEDALTFETFSLTAKDSGTAEFAEAFTRAVIGSQAGSEFSSIPTELKESMGRFYADLFYDYTAGNAIDPEILSQRPEYDLWLRFAPASDYVAEMRAMVAEAGDDFHDWSCPAP